MLKPLAGPDTTQDVVQQRGFSVNCNPTDCPQIAFKYLLSRKAHICLQTHELHDLPRNELWSGLHN